MIVMLKYNDKGMRLFGCSSAEDFLPVDAILLAKAYLAGFPDFDITTEIVGGVARRKAGEFSIKFSHLQNELSAEGPSLRDFVRSGTRNYKFEFFCEISGFKFHGVFKSEDIEHLFNDLTSE